MALSRCLTLHASAQLVITGTQMASAAVSRAGD